MPMPKWGRSMTDEDVDRVLRELMNDIWLSTCEILEVPGVYELVSQHLHREVLERWAEEQADGLNEDEEGVGYDCQA